MREKRGLEALPDPSVELSAEDTGELPSHLFWIWTAFALLSRTRTVNQTGPQPISLRDLEAYCALENIGDEDSRRELLYHITILDIEWCKVMHEKMEKSQEKARKEADRKGNRRR